MATQHIMQARDSVTGEKYTWISEIADFAGVGYPGPNVAQECAVVAKNGSDAGTGTPIDRADLKPDVLTSVLVNAQTGTTYTLALTDAGSLVTLTNAAAIVLTIPTNATVAFPVGTIITLAQRGGGQVTVTPAGGVTRNAFNSATRLSGVYAYATLTKIGTDTWDLSGQITV